MLIKSVLVVGRPLFADGPHSHKTKCTRCDDTRPSVASPGQPALHKRRRQAAMHALHDRSCALPVTMRAVRAPIRCQVPTVHLHPSSCLQTMAGLSRQRRRGGRRSPGWRRPRTPSCRALTANPCSAPLPAAPGSATGPPAEQQRQAADDARATPPHQPRAGRRDHHAGGQADVRSRPAAPGRGRRALLAPLTPPCALPAPCRWPFAVGFAVSSYIFIKVAASVTGERLQPAPAAATALADALAARSSPGCRRPCVRWHPAHIRTQDVDHAVTP